MEERQKIFEEEIIKRVKEIQSYAKTLHMHLKKIQQTSNKRNEDIQILKEELVQQIKDCHDLVASSNSRGHSNLTDQAVHDLLERRLKLADSEVALQIEHLEQKLVKDFDGKLTR
jgi:Rad3-related DNA helicase